MSCAAAILKACARSRSMWCGPEQTSVRRPWRMADSCRCGGRGVMAAGVVGHASTLMQSLLFYVCCCLNRDEQSDLCPDWTERSGDDGESEALSLWPSVLFHSSDNRDKSKLLSKSGLVLTPMQTLVTILQTTVPHIECQHHFKSSVMSLSVFMPTSSSVDQTQSLQNCQWPHWLQIILEDWGKNWTFCELLIPSLYCQYTI